VPENPNVFTVEIKLDVFSAANPSIVDVSCGRDMYPSVPSPFTVDTNVMLVVFISVVY
jgi:hypothetical protein